AWGRKRLGGGDRTQYRAGLVSRLGVLIEPVGVGHYPTARLDVGGAVAHQRGTNGDREVSITGEVEVTDDAAVQAAPRLLHLFDQLHRPYLRRAGQSAGREACGHRVQGRVILAQQSGHRGHQVHHVAIAFDVAVILDSDGARRADPAEVVAPEIDQHQ